MAEKEIITQKSPIVDLTSIVGIESIFQQGVKDPSGPEIAGYFADLFIWSDQIRYILPIPSDKEPHLPDLFKKIELLDKQILLPEQYSVSKTPKLANKTVKESFINFTIWINKNREWFLHWIDLHYQPWIRNVHNAWIGRDYFYDIEAFKNLPIFEQTALRLDIETFKLLYAFDILLRYPYYGKLAGNNTFYLAHPIRSCPRLKGVEEQQAPLPTIPFSFKDSTENYVEYMDLEHYTILLHEARNLVRDEKYHTLKPTEVTRDILREVAVKLSLPARLKKIPIPEPLKDIVDIATPFIPEKLRCLKSIVTTFWEKPLPGPISKITWLHPLLRWDLEKQAINRKAPYILSPPHNKGLYGGIKLFCLPALDFDELPG